ncbi:993fe8f5-93c2-4288-a4b0-2a77636f5464 [Thermothielavioides terrestris]|jgi:hypothetical protein
MKTR